MLGSLTLYRRLLNAHLFNRQHFETLSLSPDAPATTTPRLPTLGHALAGVLAGSTVSFIAAPVEHVKARLQVQYSANKAERLYQGPIDCTKKLLKGYGMKGLWHGLGATLIFRSFFFFWWGSYDLFTGLFQERTSLSTPCTFSPLCCTIHSRRGTNERQQSTSGQAAYQHKSSG